MSAVFLFALAGFGLVCGQSCSGSLLISSQADTVVLQSCQTFDGDITVTSDATGTIALDGVQQLAGDLTCRNATQLTSLTSDQLKSIGGTFGLQDLTIMSNLQFDSLANVSQISWVGLPALQVLSFAQGVQKANDVLISNTQLNSASGLELATLANLNINNNLYLTSISSLNLINVTGSLVIEANSRALPISMPNLVSAATLTLRDVSSVYLPSLNTIDADFSVYNGRMQNISLSSLHSTGGSLEVANCGALSSLDLPELTQIGGGLLISNNTELTNISGMRQLTIVVGAVDLVGDFDSVSLPLIRDIRGGMNVQSSSPAMNCSVLENDHSAGIIKGVFTCLNGVDSPSSNGSSTTSSGASSSPTGPVSGGAGSSSGLGAGAYAGIAIGAVAAVVVAGLVIWFCIMKPKRKRLRETMRNKEYTLPADKSELPLGQHHEKSELPSDPNHVSELAGDRKYTTHREAGKEVVPGAVKHPVKPHNQATHSSRILGPHELAWEDYQASLHEEDPVHEITNNRSLQNTPAIHELTTTRSLNTTSISATQSSELAERGSTVRRKPVEMATEPRSQSKKSSLTSTQNQSFGTSPPPLPVAAPAPVEKRQAPWVSSRQDSAEVKEARRLSV